MPKRDARAFQDSDVIRPLPQSACKKLRRSPHFAKEDEEAGTLQSQLPSPDFTIQDLSEQHTQHKEVKQTEIEHLAKTYSNRTEYWVYERGRLPPADFEENPHQMTSRGSGKRGRSPSASETTQMSERYARLRENRVCMEDARNMSATNQAFCKKLLEGNRAPVGLPVYRKEDRYAVQVRAAIGSEAIIQRDILPTVVPSIENIKLFNLDNFKDVDLEAYAEEINAEWTKPSTMGGKRPKPDYVVAVKSSAFDSSTWNALQRYSTPDTPVLHSPELCFPLFLAEAKKGAVGIQMALLQVVQAGAIAVNSQIQLHWEAYGKSHPRAQELYGKPLVFSVCHNHDEVHILAHYALLEDEKLQFYYYKVAFLSLTLNNGRDQDMPNTFVENVYKFSGPMHLKRLREAANALRTREEAENMKEKPNKNEEDRQTQDQDEPESRTSTGVSFSAANLDLDDSDDDQESALDDSQGSRSNVFKKPRIPTKKTAAKGLEEIRMLMQQQQEASKRREQQLMQDSRQREDKLEKQLEEIRMLMQQQQEASKRREEQLIQDFKQREDKLEKQRQEGKERELKLEKQMDEQSEQLKKLTEMLASKAANR